MRFGSNLGSAALGALIVSAALPALAGGKYFAKAKVESTSTAANGVIVTGPAWSTKAKG